MTMRVGNDKKPEWTSIFKASIFHQTQPHDRSEVECTLLGNCAWSDVPFDF